MKGGERGMSRGKKGEERMEKTTSVTFLILAPTSGTTKCGIASIPVCTVNELHIITNRDRERHESTVFNTLPHAPCAS